MLTSNSGLFGQGGTISRDETIYNDPDPFCSAETFTMPDNTMWSWEPQSAQTSEPPTLSWPPVQDADANPVVDSMQGWAQWSGPMLENPPSTSWEQTTGYGLGVPPITLTPESPFLTTPPMSDVNLPRIVEVDEVDDTPRTTYKSKGKEKSVSPPSPPPSRPTSPVPPWTDEQASEILELLKHCKSLEIQEDALLQLAILASRQESPSHQRINDDVVEGESPAGPSNARPDDDEPANGDNDQPVHVSNDQVREVRVIFQTILKRVRIRALTFPESPNDRVERH